MNAIFTQYDPATGKPTMWASVPADMLPIQQDNIVFGRVNPATEYVLDRTITPRPACPATLARTVTEAGEGPLCLINVALPATLFINGQSFEVDSETVELEFPNAGTYAMRLEHWPHLDGHFEVTV